MAKLILVPLDGSAFAENALASAIPLAMLHDCRLLLTRVVANPAPFVESPQASVLIHDELLASAAAYLQDVADRTSSEYGVGVDVDVVTGHRPAEVLGESVRRHRADLVAIATHGRSGFSRLWLGSVADALVRTVPIPLLLVHRSDSRIPPSPGLFRHLMIAVDGSPFSEAIIGPTTHWFGKSNTRYTLFMVDVPAVEMAPPGIGLLTPTEIAGESHSPAAREYLSSRAQDLVTQGYTVQTNAVEYHSAAEAILHFAREQDVDAIALSTHGRGGVSRFLIGSVADKVIRSASTPVFTQRFDSD